MSSARPVVGLDKDGNYSGIPCVDWQVDDANENASGQEPRAMKMLLVGLVCLE